MVRLDVHAFGRLRHDHRRVIFEQVHQPVVMGGIEVLNQNESHSGIGRKCSEELLTKHQAAGRGRANCDDQKIR